MASAPRRAEPVPNWTYLVLHFAHTLALGVWTGGILLLGGLVAPAVFGSAQQRDDASRTMGTIFGRFDRIVVAMCIPALLITSVLMVLWYGRMSPWYAIQYVCIAMMSGSGLYGAFVLTPRITALREQGAADTSAFGRLHRTSVSATQFNLACGCVALFFS